MTSIVGVHGIWNFRYFQKTARDLDATTARLSGKWAAWLAAGLAGTGVRPPARIPVAYYADCLNRGTPMGPEDDPEWLEGFEREVFVELVEEVRRAQAPPGAPEPVAMGFPGAEYVVSQPAEWLSERYGELAVGAVTLLAREVATYLGGEHEDRRVMARERVAQTIADHEPDIVLAHSLGTVVAYEALHAHPELAVGTLVTLGSPLAVRNVIYDRLEPRPDPLGRRPPGVRRWINIADKGDPVAVPSGRLGERFSGVDVDHPRESIHRYDLHFAKHYLGSPRLAEVLGPLITR